MMHKGEEQMSRRNVLKYLAAVFAWLLWPTGKESVADKTAIEHPYKDPLEYTKHLRCDNCGMDRNKWARTRYSFNSPKGELHTCSIHCLAVLSVKLKTAPRDVMAAEYFHPENMLDAEKAFYVIGSRAPGTMTISSKIAFSSREEAEAFARKQGGRTAGFEQAMKEAMNEIKHHIKSHE